MISYFSMGSGMKCASCGKGVMYGHEVSHAKNRTKRLFKPNLHFARVMFEGLPRPLRREASGKAGRMKRMRLCAKCLRMLKKKISPRVSQQPTAAL